MKKLSLLIFTLLIVSCGEEDLYVAPGNDDVQAVDIIEEKSSSTDQIFTVVENPPTFPGGNKAYFEYLGKHLQYPKEAKKMGIEGNVYISFVVNTDGSLSDFEVLRTIGGGCDEEALRVFMSGPNWEPGIQRGKAVKTRMQAKVAFKLDDKAVTSISTRKPELVEEIIFESEALD